MHLDPLLPRLLSAALVLLLMGLALRRLRQPLVVVYLLAGAALGPAGARLLTDEVGEFSFVLAAVGREEGIIQEFAYQVTVGLIAFTLLLSPLVVWGAGRLVGAGGRPPAETGRAEPSRA